MKDILSIVALGAVGLLIFSAYKKNKEYREFLLEHPGGKNQALDAYYSASQDIIKGNASIGEYEGVRNGGGFGSLFLVLSGNDPTFESAYW